MVDDEHGPARLRRPPAARARGAGRRRDHPAGATGSDAHQALAPRRPGRRTRPNAAWPTATSTARSTPAAATRCWPGCSTTCATRPPWSARPPGAASPIAQTPRWEREAAEHRAMLRAAADGDAERAAALLHAITSRPSSARELSPTTGEPERMSLTPAVAETLRQALATVVVDPGHPAAAPTATPTGPPTPRCPAPARRRDHGHHPERQHRRVLRAHPGRGQAGRRDGRGRDRQRASRACWPGSATTSPTAVEAAGHARDRGAAHDDGPPAGAPLRLPGRLGRLPRRDRQRRSRPRRRARTSATRASRARTSRRSPSGRRT